MQQRLVSVHVRRVPLISKHFRRSSYHCHHGLADPAPSSLLVPNTKGWESVSGKRGESGVRSSQAVLASLLKGGKVVTSFAADAFPL